MATDNRRTLRLRPVGRQGLKCLDERIGEKAMGRVAVLDIDRRLVFLGRGEDQHGIVRTDLRRGCGCFRKIWIIRHGARVKVEITGYIRVLSAPRANDPEWQESKIAVRWMPRSAA